MKKLILICFIFILTGCSFTTKQEYVVDEATKAEIKQQLLAELKEELKIEYQPSLLEIENQIRVVLDHNLKAVIGVSNFQMVGSTLQQAGTGSGVIYKLEYDAVADKDYYYAITNEHVVDAAHEVHVVINGDTYVKAQLLGSDKLSDIAVIRFEYDEPLKVSKFANSDQLQSGQIAIAIGNPLGYDYFGTVTMGVISGLSRGLNIDYDNDKVIDWKATLIQHDASISPGNSGGPLYNLQGEVIGINNMKIVETNASNIGFAIPSNTATKIAAILETEGVVKRPLLGIQGRDINILRQQGEVFPKELDGGVQITVISDNGSSDGSGLRVGDIITEYNGIKIDTFDELRAAINDSVVGETVKVKVYRNGSYHTYDVTLKERPMP